MTQTFVLIFGPSAVGKMTVGQELEKLTGLKLFHNHQTIELVLNYFDFTTPVFQRLVREFRLQLFEAVSNSDLKGLTFTYSWAHELPSEKEFIDEVTAIFEAKGWKIIYVELSATLSERLSRNTTENRLREKPSKRDLEFSMGNLMDMESKHTFNTNDDFVYKHKNYLKIDNTNSAPSEVAMQIAERFEIPLVDKET